MRSELIQQYYDSPEYLAKLRTKVMNMKDLEEDEFFRAEQVLDVYAIDPIAFIETFCMIKMTEGGGMPRPFFLFDYQKDIILKIQEAENTNNDIEYLIDKPRGMGVTWIIAAYFLWRWLYTPNYSAFILSRTETEVDDGTRTADSCIFGKIRYMIDHLPRWMLPEGYQPKGSKGTTTDATLKLINPSMQSALIGSTTNSNAGRSRRYRTVFIDECFSIDRFSEVWRSLQSVSRLKLFVSTVKQGRVFEEFKKMCEANDAYISLTWKDHPFKDQLWYEEQLKKAEFDPEVMKEIQVDYSIDPRSAYYPEVRQSTLQPVEYDHQRPLYISMDIGRQDLTVILYWQYDGMFKLVDCYFNKMKDLEWYVPFLNPEALWSPEYYNEYQQKFITKVKHMTKPKAYFGELAHFNKVMPLNLSNADILSKYGIRLLYNNNAMEYQPRRIATARMLPKTIFNSSSDAVMRAYDAIAQSRYAGAVRATSEQLKPAHDDDIGDFRAAVENFAVNIPKLFRVQREDIPQADKSFASAVMKQLRS